MTRARLFRATFLGVQTLTIGVALPILSAYAIRGWPPGLSLRWTHGAAPAADLGFAWSPEALEPAARQSQGFEDLMAVGLALALVVLLLGCVTLASLVIRRGWDRRLDLSIHVALGASKRDLRGTILHELAVLLALGTGLGLGLGLGLDAWLRAVAPGVLVPPGIPISLLGLVGLLGPALAVLAAASMEATGAVRRLRAPLRVNPAARLARLGLGVGHLAATLALLTAGALLMSGATALEQEPVGVGGPRDTLVIDLATPDAAGWARLAELTAPDPESSDASPAWHLASAGALESLGVADRLTAECNCVLGQIVSPTVQMFVQHHSVSPGAFGALGYRVVRGREFTPDDRAGAPLVAVIDGRTHDLFRNVGVDPLGKTVQVGPMTGFTLWYRIVGIVDVPEPPMLGSPSTPLGGLYLSSLQHRPSEAQLLVAGTAGDPAEVVATLAALAPELDVVRATSLAERLLDWAAPIPWFAGLALLLAVVALVVATQGLSSSIALEVDAQTQELGVRRALGARRGAIVRSVLRDVVRVVVWGGALGIPAAAGLGSGLGSRFPVLEAFDFRLAFVVLGVLALAVLVGALGSLRRAVRITPIEAMGAMQ